MPLDKWVKQYNSVMSQTELPFIFHPGISGSLCKRLRLLSADTWCGIFLTSLSFFHPHSNSQNALFTFIWVLWLIWLKNELIPILFVGIQWAMLSRMITLWVNMYKSFQRLFWNFYSIIKHIEFFKCHALKILAFKMNSAPARVRACE